MRVAKFVSLSLSAAMIAGMVGMTGCGARTDNNNVRTQSLRNNDGRNYDVNSLPQGNRMFSRSAGNGQSERITSLKYSPALSNKVAGLSDVQAAHVVVTDRDAYVALTLHGANAQSRMSEMSTGTTTNRGTTNYGGPYGADYGTRGAGDNGLARGLTGRSGTAGSLFDMNRGNGPANGRNTGNGLMGNDMGLRGFNGDNGRRGIGTDMGAGLSGTATAPGSPRMTGTGTFNGLGNGTGAGSVTDNVPQRVKDQVSDVVKKTAPHIRNVYVSGNSDFVSQVGNYATQSRGGATLNGFIADFQNMIQRIFPARAGTMPGPNGYAPTRPNGLNNGTMDRSGINTDGYTGGVSR
ncbi:YhcN/YlaJ family sporulation lipoprotein [Fontibacillus phaseoli]|uniref:YhcN/YlaJ family sporulation lipoprotein n=1 Tax=Fontibacillus phaseoli TaxID=1416533 RepID=A0A369BGR2_9BACL|nr:YhcN/YlaJ family sporulation lipoprotein [Fontibacillus phaseoli]RCX19788.1 YhcN/YlaJ family sporulation lipoprotein [Fontibacillus phaseoli]